MTLTPRVPAGLAVLLTTAFVLAACGSSATTTATATVTAGAVSAVASSAPPGAAPAGTPDPCSLLTAAQVSAATGGTVGEGVASAGTPPLNGKKCNWSNTGSPVIDFEVKLTTAADVASTSQTVDDLFGDTTTTFPGLTAATGIGDKAFFGKTNGYVVKGGVLIETVADIGGTADSSSINKTLTTMAVAKLP